MKNIALIFDFDDTLMPDSTSRFLQAHGIDVEEFWGRTVKELLSQGYEPALAYLNRILEIVGPERPLGLLTNEKLRDFGRSLGKDFYPGVSGLFKDLEQTVQNISSELKLEFYLISGGLQDMIEEIPLVKREFRAVYGCQFGEDPQSGVIHQIKRSVSFTEKTRYLFEINKGIGKSDLEANNYAVNIDVPAARRRIPFRNMIYVGDGLTDIPCFSLLKNMGGMAFGVFNPGKESSAKRALLEFLKTDRVISMHAPRYRKQDELGALLRVAVQTIAQRALLSSSEANFAD